MCLYCVNTISDIFHREGDITIIYNYCIQVCKIVLQYISTKLYVHDNYMRFKFISMLIIYKDEVYVFERPKYTKTLQISAKCATIFY